MEGTSLCPHRVMCHMVEGHVASELMHHLIRPMALYYLEVDKWLIVSHNPVVQHLCTSIVVS